MLPTDKTERKERPLARGVLDYFPDALAAIAHVSYVGNEQHNPGQPMHWARDKSSDHADCLLRHLADRGDMDNDGLRHTAKAAWRALALLQVELEKAGPAADRDLTATEVHMKFAREKLLLARHQANRKLEADIAKALALLPASTFTTTAVARPKPRLYIAGPMRGLPDNNFPAFDAARNRFEAIKKWHVISPADMDRVAGDDTLNCEDANHPEVCRRFMKRDLDVLGSFRAEDGEAIAMLDGWERSTGAVAEFMVARWAGLAVLDAYNLKPLQSVRTDLLCRSAEEYVWGKCGRTR